MKHGKKYIDAAKLIENNKTYDPTEALELCCKTATAKFDETVELHVRLGVDSRHADQQVRGAVVLPNGTGKRLVRSSTVWTSRTSSMCPSARPLSAPRS